MKNYLIVLDVLQLTLGPIIFLLILLVHQLGVIPVINGAVEDRSPKNITFPAMFVIGDSTVDPGNNNHIILTPCRSNFPPYGRDFIGRKATGRFSNGKLVTDFVAAKLGIKEILPAYFEPGLNTSDFLTGVSFGSAATGLDNLTAEISLGIPLWKQLKFLEKTLERLKVEVGRETVEEIVSEALFFVSSGSVDYLLTYFHTPFRRVQYNLSEYINFMVQASSGVVRELYRLGARKIVHIGLPPLGCVPLERTLHAHPNRECSEEMNSACLQHKSQLLQEIEKLDKERDGCKVIYFDMYSVFLDIILNFQKYGFEEERLGCCGTGTQEGGISCNEFVSTCKNASTHVFWDSVHPTERACEMIANDVVQTVVSKFG